MAVIHCNDYQIGLIRHALDFYMRVLGLAQLEEVEYHLAAHLPLDDGYEDRRGVIRDACNDIKAVLGYHPNASASIRSEAVPKEYRVAYDMIQVIRKAQAEKRLETATEEEAARIRFGVDTDSYWATADEPAIVVEAQ